MTDRRTRRVFRRSVRDEVAAELGFHAAMHARDLIAAGMDPVEAEQVARRRLIDTPDIGAQCVSIGEATARHATRREYLTDWSGDIRFAWRQLRRAPAFTLGVVLSLALGIGLSTSVFSVLDAIFWRWPAGVTAPAAVQRVWTIDRRGNGAEIGSTDLEYPRYRAIADAAAPMASALYTVVPDASLHWGSATLTTRLAYATSSFFPLLGARPLLGRTYRADEDRMGAAAPLLVVSERFWRHQLGGNPDVIGMHLALDHANYTVIGVLTAPFAGPDLEAVDAWAPLGGYPGTGFGGAPWWDSRNYSGFQMLIRTPSSAPAPSLNALATAALHRADALFGSPDSTARVVTGSLIVARGPGERAPELAIATRLGGVAAILMLIVMANVLGLMLSRAVRRRHEIAMRLALGIGRGRLARLLLTESGMLALLAGAAAVAAAVWGGGVLRTLLFPGMQWAVPPMHWHVIAFAGAAALLTALVAGLVPLTALLRSGVSGASKAQPVAGGRGGTRLRGATVIVQVALSAVLLVGAALFVQSLRNVHGLAIGYDADRLLYAAVRTGDSADPAAVAAHVDAIVASFAVATGIEQISRSSAVPLQRGGFGVPWYVGADSMGARPGFRPTGSRVAATYRATIGLVLLQGEDLHQGAHQVLVNETMAQTIWPGRSPLGACIQFGSRNAPCHLVSGVVRDGKRSSLTEPPLPQYFVASDDSDTGLPDADFVVVRVAPGSVGIVKTRLHQRLAAAFPDGRITVIALDETLDELYRPWRLGAWLFAVFGMLALVVAAIGVYSTVSYEVAQRRREFGIRAALGAGFGQIVTGALRAALSPVVGGIVAGMLGALVGGRLVGALLYGIRSSDPLTMAAVASLLLLVSGAAALLPAWRAARSNPLVALRDE